MDLQFTGLITNVGQTTTGTSAKGEWSKVEFMVQEVGPRYPQSAAFTLFGDRVAQYADTLILNALVTVKFDITAREYNGRFYNSLNAWSVTMASAAPQPMPANPTPLEQYAQQPLPQQGYQQPIAQAPQPQQGYQAPQQGYPQQGYQAQAPQQVDKLPF